MKRFADARIAGQDGGRGESRGHRHWAAWCLIACLVAGTGGRADDVTLDDGTVVRGTILRLRPDSILVLADDGTTRTAALDAGRRFTIDLAAGPRCVHVVDGDGRRRLVRVTECVGRRLSGTDLEGEPVAFEVTKIREAVVYPVAKPRHVLDVPYVRQKPDLCGEACVEMVSAFLGRQVSQDKVNEAGGLDGKRGCHAQELIAALRKLDLPIVSEESWPGASDDDFLADRIRLIARLRDNHPVLLGISGIHEPVTRNQTFDHMVLLVGYDLVGERFVIHDPGRWPQWEVSFPAFVNHRRNTSRELCQVEFALFRTWKTGDGAELPGALVELGDRTIRIAPRAGAAVELAIADLDADSAGFVARLKAGRAAPGPGGPTAAGHAHALYLSARESATRGDAAEALALLDRAVATGFTQFGMLQADKAFDAVRTEAKFQALLADRERIVAEFLAQATTLLLERLGKSHAVVSEANDPYVVIAAGGAAAGKQTTDILRTITGLHGKTLFTNQGRGGFIVVLTDDAEAFAALRGGGPEARTSAGFYNHGTRTLVIRRGTGAGTIAHEFTHALHFADMEALGQTHPIWVREGLGSLYEESDPREGGLVGLVNWRLPQLKQALAGGQVYPLRAFLENSEKCFAERGAIAYAMSRYLCFFLQEKQLLFPWYARYCRTYADDPSGIRSLEETYGKPLDQLEPDWIEFVKALE
jgi:hypothetical protein